jgi:formate dehydrogenase accessory protein FdhE
VESEDVSRSALAAARGKHPELQRTIDLELELRGVPATIVVPPEFAALAAARIAAGAPAIDPSVLPLDWAAVGARIRAVCAIVSRADPRLAGATAAIADNAAEARELAAGFLTGAIDDGVAVLVLTHALRPYLDALATVALRLPAVQDWHRGDCPACGGAPDFAALEGEGGSRRLLCSRCDGEWRYARVGCPFCDNKDPKSLAYFSAIDGRYRLYVCEQCRAYLKTLDRREAFDESPLAVERVLAVGLDLAAAREGYGRAGRRLPVLPS